jgi:hypothetical protein
MKYKKKNDYTPYADAARSSRLGLRSAGRDTTEFVAVRLLIE